MTKATDAATTDRFMTLLRKHRMAKGLTATALAARLGVSLSSVSFWESGQKLPGPKLIPKLARLLGMKPMELIDIIENEPAK